MMAAVRTLTDEWRERRAAGVSSTDIPILLGLSPYRSEADLAREKRGEPTAEPGPDQQRLMRLGSALENVTRAEDELEHGIKLRRINRLITHPDIPWAVTSLDFERVGERCIVETKASRAGRWSDGLPQDVEAQVRWQMGVAQYPRAHVAVLRSGSELLCFDVEHDSRVFGGLVTVAEDFRLRLLSGGEFEENAASVKARYPADDGTEVVADADVSEAVRTLVALRSQRKALEDQEEAIETAVKARMGDAAVLVGPDFRVTWKRTKDREEVDWKNIATGLLNTLSETDRQTVVGLSTTVRPGFRPFRVVMEGKE